MTLGVLVILILVGVGLYKLNKRNDKEVETVVEPIVVEPVVETVKKPRKPRKKWLFENLIELCSFCNRGANGTPILL